MMLKTQCNMNLKNAFETLWKSSMTIKSAFKEYGLRKVQSLWINALRVAKGGGWWVGVAWSNLSIIIVQKIDDFN